MRMPECSIEPRPRHSKNSRSSYTSVSAVSAAALPPRVTTRAYWFSTSARPSAICSSSIQIDCSISSGSNPDTTTGLP
jgi:hypothetical protein